MAYRNTQFRPTKLVRALTLAGMATLLSASPAILAQQNEETTPEQVQEQDVEVITVTGGFRGSLASALNQKRFETGATDTIKAEDIADFPDLNLAESLQRLPGVAISRVAGEGRQISVRGLGPDFTRVRINGMEAQSTSGGTDAVGGANRGRGFDFNTFSSDLFSELTVRKTASANVEEGSLGATVDLRTARPFDYDALTFAANVQAGYNDLSEEVDPKASFLFSNINEDSTFGYLISAAFSERNIKDDGASTVRWNNVNDFGSYQGATPTADVPVPELTAINDAFRPRLPRYDSYTHNVKRTGAAVAFEYRPTMETRFNLDVLYSKDDSTRNEVFTQAILNNNAISAAMNVLDYEVDNTNTVTYASFENAVVRNENRYDELSTEFLQFTLSAQHQLTDNLKIDGMIGRAKSEFDNPIQTTVVMEKQGVDFSYDYRGSKRGAPELLFGAEVYDPNDWTINSLRLRPLGAENTFDSAAVNLEYVLTDALTLRGGLHYKSFGFDTREARLAREGGLVGTNNVPMPSELIMPYSSGLGSQGPWLIPDLNAFAAAYNIYSNSGDYAVSTDNRRADNYSAEEDTLGAYLQLAFDTELGNTVIRGDIGGRYVRTDQSSTAWANLGGTQTLITAKHDYNEFLPSLNLVFEPMDDVIIRFGYAEVMARAGLGSIRPNVSVSASGGARTIQGGNPTLEPTKAKTYDLGLELYFDNESLLGLAVFRKEIDSYVQGLRETKPFTETGLPIQAAIDACTAGPGYGAEFGCTENDEWQTNTPLNGPGGDLYGFEIQYQMPFTFLPEFWDRFGFIGNFTYVKAQLDYVNADGQLLVTRDLQGLSQNTHSATLYYEDEKFSARVSMAYRDKYLTNALGRDNNVMEGTNATRNIDAALSYQLTDQWKISFEALNLSDEVDDQWVDSTGNRLTYYHATGRQYYLGAQYKF